VTNLSKTLISFFSFYTIHPVSCPCVSFHYFIWPISFVTCRHQSNARVNCQFTVYGSCEKRDDSKWPTMLVLYPKFLVPQKQFWSKVKLHSCCLFVVRSHTLPSKRWSFNAVTACNAACDEWVCCICSVQAVWVIEQVQLVMQGTFPSKNMTHCITTELMVQ
jgi:hypothetical protein